MRKETGKRKKSLLAQLQILNMPMNVQTYNVCRMKLCFEDMHCNWQGEGTGGHRGRLKPQQLGKLAGEWGAVFKVEALCNYLITACGVSQL